MNMKKFDRLLNIALVVAVVFYAVDYFVLRETPSSFDGEKKAFAPVELSKVEHKATTQPVFMSATPSDAMASSADASSMGTGGPAGDEPPPFSPLSWEQLEAEVSSDVPTLVIVFASWCPYCKKLMPEVISLANEKKENLNVLAVSIDEDPSAIRSYVSSLPSLPPFTVHVNGTDNERSVVQAFLYKNKFNFTGAIPYMAIFHKGKPIQQLGGYVEKSVLTQLLSNIEQQKKS